MNSIFQHLFNMSLLKNKPLLRFPEFTSAWEEKKISEIFERVVNPVDVDKKETYQELGIRSHGKGIFHKQPKLGAKIGNKRVFWVKENTFIVNIVFAWEQAVAKTTEKEVGLIASHRFPMYDPIKNVLDLDFILSLFLRKKGKNILELASPGGAGRNKTLGQKVFSDTEVIIPKIQEQTKISSFLKLNDDRLNVLINKKETLEAYKEGIIRKIFNKDIRFKDKNGNDFPDWEEKFLGEIGEFRTSSVDKKTIEGEPEVRLINYMNVYKHENITNKNKDKLMIVSAKETQLKSSNLLKGDILFTPSSETPSDIGHSIVISENLENTLFSYHLMRFRPAIEIDILYSHYFCNIPSVLKQITRYTISVGSFSKIKVQLPSIKEQKKIASFLFNIDNSIKNISNQIKKSKKFKEGLVQKMFV